MANKTQLQTNNTNLDALITRVNAAKDVAASLPEAAGGEAVDFTINQIFFKDMTRETVSIKQDTLSLFIPDIQKTKYVIVIGGSVKGILGPDNGYTMEVSGTPDDIFTSITITTGLSSSTSDQTKLTINGAVTHIDLLTSSTSSTMNYLLEVI